MPTFLINHVKIQQLESRLNKNNYLSNTCLPNFIDAQVYKALKSHDKIPKRQLYPNFYHWYILIRQFADRTIDMWIKDHQLQHLKDQIILDIIEIIKGANTQTQTQVVQNTIESTKFKKKTHDNSQNSLHGSSQKFLISSCEHKPKSMMDLTKSFSLTEKRIQHQYQSIIDYIMDIKLNINMHRQLDDIQKMFTDDKVQVESVKIYTRNQQQSIGSDIRVQFATNYQTCQQLKNKILRNSDVDSIQCKKYKKNQSQSPQLIK